jgi:ABC-2 type transport system ATP-binding protein
MIEVKNIAKRFGNKEVLRDVSLSVPAGSIYGLIGHNGAGKTTLMTIMAGLCHADSGEVNYNGKNICYLPDVPRFFEHLSCGEYLDFLASALDGPQKRSREELLSLVGLEAKTKVGSMSRGMRQRLGIAAVLVNDPDVLLLDEPTSALDPSGRMELISILKKLRMEGKSILLSTHILADMESVCDEVAFLHKGIICKHLYIDDLQKTNSWVIEFEDSITSVEENDNFLISLSNEKTMIIQMPTDRKLESQSAVFEYLRKLNNPIKKIRNEFIDLDHIFQEVCNS